MTIRAETAYAEFRQICLDRMVNSEDKFVCPELVADEFNNDFGQLVRNCDMPNLLIRDVFPESFGRILYATKEFALAENNVKRNEGLYDFYRYSNHQGHYTKRPKTLLIAEAWPVYYDFYKYWKSEGKRQAMYWAMIACQKNEILPSSGFENALVELIRCYRPDLLANSPRLITKD